jgi:HTH-type transcriptional regulator, competence development regulator
MGNTLRETLRLARKLKGLTLREAEGRTGISNAYISQVETGKVKNPSPHKLRKLAEAYGIPYESLMQTAGYLPGPKSGPPKRPSAIQTALMGARLTPEEERKVSEFIEFLLSRRLDG